MEGTSGTDDLQILHLLAGAEEVDSDPLAPLLGPVSVQQPLPAEGRPPAGGAEPSSLHTLVFTSVCCNGTTRNTWLTITLPPQSDPPPLAIHLHLSSHSFPVQPSAHSD